MFKIKDELLKMIENFVQKEYVPIPVFGPAVMGCMDCSNSCAENCAIKCKASKSR